MDGYFSNSNLAAWQLKHSLIMIPRFAWADVENGKGLSTDDREFNNDCPYDFRIYNLKNP